MNDQELLEACLDGDATAQDAVKERPDLQQQAHAHRQMDAALRILHESRAAHDGQVRAIMGDLRARRRRRPRAILLLAASILLLLGLGAWALLNPAVPVPTGTTMTLHAGEHGRYTTPDGDTFTLTGPADLIAGHTLHLQEGRLQLRAGKRPAHEPLVILTPHARAEVLGTKFVLQTTPEATRLTVSEGRVRFVPHDGDPVFVTPGGEATASHTRRNPFRQPFASDSPWNTALGSLTRLEPVPTLRLERGLHIETREWSVPVYVAEPADPLRTLFHRDSGQPAGQVGIAPSLPAGDGKDDRYLALIDARLDTAWELSGAAREPNGDYRAGEIARTSLHGTGWGMSAPGHSGASLLGGLLRRGELARNVPHPLAVLVRAGAINRSDRPFEWPATHALKRWELYGNAGNLRLGSLLALPSDLDLSGLTGPAHVLAQALQDYGAYVVGTFNTGQQDLVILAEHAADPDLTPQTAAALAPLIVHLQRVANNTPETPGGGGTPRRPPPPPLFVLPP
jgi:hypothetical protein